PSCTVCGRGTLVFFFFSFVVGGGPRLLLKYATSRGGRLWRQTRGESLKCALKRGRGAAQEAHRRPPKRHQPPASCAAAFWPELRRVIVSLSFRKCTTLFVHRPKCKCPQKLRLFFFYIYHEDKNTTDSTQIPEPLKWTSFTV
uniref:Uncharacterized protein n=1 Tax=Gasterosteus aculeatus TaxID=69293 RepID=G3PNQ0_GASAC